MSSIIETPKFEIAEENILDLVQKLADHHLDHCFLCEALDQPIGNQGRKTVIISSLLPLDTENAEQIKKQLSVFQNIIPGLKGNHVIKDMVNTL